MSKPEGRHVNRIVGLEYQGNGLVELHLAGGEGPVRLLLPLYLFLELHWLLCAMIADMQGVQDYVLGGGRKRWNIGAHAYPPAEEWAPQADPGPGVCLVPIGG